MCTAHDARMRGGPGATRGGTMTCLVSVVRWSRAPCVVAGALAGRRDVAGVRRRAAEARQRGRAPPPRWRTRTAIRTPAQIRILLIARVPCAKDVAAADNGGTTAPGVTRDAVKVVIVVEEDPTQAADDPGRDRDRGTEPGDRLDRRARRRRARRERDAQAVLRDVRPRRSTSSSTCAPASTRPRSAPTRSPSPR